LPKFKIKITKHCEDRCSDRNVTKEQIFEVVENPMDVFYDEERGNFKCCGTVIQPPYTDEPYLVVIYQKFNIEIKVITVMWKSKGGLKSIGFSNI